MSNADTESKQATQAPSPPHDGWLTRAQVAAELGYRSIFPIRKMEGTKLHPVREARGWVFNPAEVAELKLTRMAPRPAAPAVSEGKIHARLLPLRPRARTAGGRPRSRGPAQRGPRAVARVADGPRGG